MTDNTSLPFSFPAVSRKKITAAFDGGQADVGWRRHASGHGGPARLDSMPFLIKRRLAGTPANLVAYEPRLTDLVLDEN